jgi:acetoin utilization protein AcuC
LKKARKRETKMKMATKKLPSHRLHVAYSDEYLDWKLGAQSLDGSHPTNAIRAQIATESLIDSDSVSVDVIDPAPTYKDLLRVLETHDSDYVMSTMAGDNGEWIGEQPRLGEVALTMFAGTVRCVEAILEGRAQVAFNPQGAKHHAGYAWSSGFCVFNDMAWAANEFVKNGYKVMYIDFDAHHGDGVEDLLRTNPNAITASIHDGTIFPGTGRSGHSPEDGVYNWALPANSGGTELIAAMNEIKALAAIEKPNVILLAAGADGHRTDPLSSLQYDSIDFIKAALIVAAIAVEHCEGRVLCGGAGGYQPFDRTPEVWVDVVSTIYNHTVYSAITT